MCTKCHAVSGQRGGPLTVSWQIELGKSPAQTRFDHRPHLDLLGPEKTCTSCHKLADTVLSVENTGLKGITLDTCEECHAAARSGTTVRHVTSIIRGTRLGKG